MAVGFDLRAPMLVDASASIQPDHSCCGAVMTQGGSSPSRRRSALVLPGFFPIAAAQHENGAHSPTIGQHLGRLPQRARPFKHPRGGGQRRNDRPRPPSSISRLGRRRILEAGFAATGDPNKKAASQAAF